MAGAAEPLLALIGAAAPGPALVCPDDGISITAAELEEAVTGLAGCLQTAGVNRGDRVAIVLDDGPELIELLFALSAVGAAGAAQSGLHQS